MNHHHIKTYEEGKEKTILNKQNNKIEAQKKETPG